MTGSETAVHVLTEDMKNMTGGQLIIEEDPEAAAHQLTQLIDERRKGLGL